MKHIFIYNMNTNDYESVGLYDICEYFIKTYPEDIFVSSPEEIVKIRKQCKKILENRK